MKQNYLIAGHCIGINGDQLCAALEQLNAFAPFRAPDTLTPLATLNLHDGEGPQTDTPLYTVDIEGTVWAFGRYANGYVFEISSPDNHCLRLWTEHGQAFLHGSLDTQLLRFACWMGYGLLTVPRHTVALHTSAIVYRSHAVAFLGESGTGKSTHTRLWREHIAGATLLNDDSPIIRIVNGHPYVYGSPWSGKTPCYKNECYPLAACVRLSQGPVNSIEKLPVAQAYAALHPSCPPAFAYDEQLYEPISQTLDAILSQVPVYHLSCLPDADAARLSCKTIFGVCEK